VDPSDRDRNDLGNVAPHGTDEPTHASGTLGQDDRWLRSVVENSSEIVTIVDLDGTLRYANPAWGRILGYYPAEDVGKINVLDYVHPEDLSHVLEETEDALSQGGITTNKAEYRFKCKDGSWRWMESVGTYLLDDPAVRGVVVVSRDVTERKESEEALLESEAEIFSVLESITDGFFALDREWRFTYVNPRAEVLLNRRREDLIGERIWEDPTFYPQCRRAVMEGKMVRFEGYYHPLGKWYSLRAYPSESGLSVYFQDVTGRKRAEEKIRFQASLLDAVGESVIALDLEGRVLYWNTAAAEMYGWSSEEAMGRRLREMVVPEGLRGRAEDIAAQLREGRNWTGEFVVRHRDGTTFPVEGTDTPVFGEDGDLVGVIGVLRDITERKRTEAALRAAEERFRRSFDDAAIGMALVAPDGRFLGTNLALCEILGYPEEDLLGKTFQDITHPDDVEGDLDHLRKMLAGEIRTYQVEKRYFHKDGHVVWVLLSVSLVQDEGGEPLYFVSQIQDASKRKAMEEWLQHQALHDALTNLPNRKLFLDRLGHALTRTERRRSRRVAVLFMDLDNFKVVNDSLGHEVGDLLLFAVAERLKGCLRSEDTLARFGGDEFVVLLEDVDDPKEPIRVAERIIDELRDPFVLDGRQLYVKASIGIALGEDRTKNSDELLRDADTAMYRAKDQSSGYSVFDPAMYERAIYRLEAESDLRRAIEREEFVVHYQPVVNLQTGELWGMEALVRWKHPERGLLSPDEFVPVAEESGLVIPMGEQVFKEACLRAKGWQEVHPRTPPLVMSVNLSARQVSRWDLAETVARILGETGLEGSRLTVDVTETAYVRALAGNTVALDGLREMGVRISIDDFGTDYSSLSYLKLLPADALKIDKSFVKGLGEDAKDTAIVRMIIELAHTFGMEVIGEGVETEEQVALLEKMGCDFAQGHHFAQPLPPEAASEFLAE
jgi:diguanylate cyclase (GGDEF)-like protein/PAS domain S-box-containing protein